MVRSNAEKGSEQRTVNVRGRCRAYEQRRTIRRRDYFLLERIGSPFRERFLAFDPLSGPGGDFFLVQRLPVSQATEQQLRVFRRLKDDSFPRVVEWQQRDNHIDVALSWTDGISLAEYLNNIRAGRRPPVAAGQAVRLFHGLAHAVCKLHHRLQIAHGDIQPTNVIVTGNPSRLHLIDFGSAWTSDRTTQRSDGDGHRRCYTAPELQAGSTPVGFAADQFSVTMLLYEVLTLQLPYAGLGGKAGRPEFVAKAKDSLRPPSDISANCKQLPRSLRQRVDNIVLKGLALNPDERYPDRHAWLNDLYDVSARFRINPELPPVEDLLTRIVHWFVKPRGDR